MYTPLSSKEKKCACQGCRCNFTGITLVESLLTPSAVPGGLIVKSNATGTASLLLTNKPEFYIHIAVRNIKNITMSHIHFYNTKDPKTNGPILLWLTKTMTNPVRSLDGTLVSQMFSTSDFEAPYKNMALQEFKNLVEHGHLYFNVHTTENPNGELAGPIAPVLQLGS
jgi:hypothetical protein